MSKIPKDIEELSRRIKELKSKNKENKLLNKEEKNPNAIIVFQITTELFAGVLVGMGIGYILDEIFDTGFIFLLIFVILGSFAGILNIYRYVKERE
ncbi:MAG: AtpZ/AtpI family protein [Alphaproteobacteria bacterium]|nr:AtpZ/AtpI family protein [Alphaproteobacteria bacterium]